MIADTEKDQACVDMSIPAGAVQWRIRDLRLACGVILKQTNLEIFAIEPALVVYGDASAEGWLDLDDVRLQVRVPSGGKPVLYRHGEMDVLVLNRNAVARCWRIEIPGAATTLLGGPDRIEDVSVADGKLRLKVASQTRASVWRLFNHEFVSKRPNYNEDAPSQDISLETVRISRALPESAQDFDDSTWYAAAQPRPMQVFGHGHGYAWYRTTFEVRDEGPQTIFFSGAEDRAHVWVDGQHIGIRGWGSSHGWHLMPNLKAGKHTLSMLVENLGMFNSGAEFDIPLGEPKGVYGPVWLNGDEITGWRMRTGLGTGEEIDSWCKPGGVIDQTPATETLDGPVWVAAEFAMPAGFDGAVRLELGAHAGKGSCWINGCNVGRYWKIGPQQSLWLPLGWLKERNTIVLFEEGRIQPDKVKVSLSSFGPQAEIQI